MRLVPVASLDDPDHRDALVGYANLKDRDLLRSDTFIAEGALVVRQLLRSRFTTLSLLLAEPRLDALRDDLPLLPQDTPVYLAPQHVLDAIAGFHVHRGVLALGRRTHAPDPATLLRSAHAAVVLEDLTNADNVGGVFRTVAALAPPGTPVLLSPRCCDPLYRKAIRVSMGHALRVPFATLDPWPDSLRLLHDAGFATFALTPSESPDSLPLAPAAPVPLDNHARRWALVLGSEGPGLSDGTLRTCTRRLRIPMSPGVDSLNVVVAAGIALHAFSHRRET